MRIGVHDEQDVRSWGIMRRNKYVQSRTVVPNSFHAMDHQPNKKNVMDHLIFLSRCNSIHSKHFSLKYIYSK